MNIYEEFEKQVKRCGKFMFRIPSSLGDKELYYILDQYCVGIDTCSFRDEDKIVIITDRTNETIIYNSPAISRMMGMSYEPDILEDLLKKMKETCLEVKIIEEG